MNDTGIETNAFLGYPDTLSVRAGERIRFHLSSHLPEADARFVRLRCADADATGPGLKYQELVSPLDGVHACQWHEVPCGSSMSVPADSRLAPAGAFSFGCHIWPTRLGAAPQTVLARWNAETGCGYALQVSRHGVTLRVGGAAAPVEVSTGAALDERRWYWIQGGIDPASGELFVHQSRLADAVLPEKRSEMRATHPAADWRLDSQGPFTVAAHHASLAPLRTAAHFDGKIEAPRIAAGLPAPDALRQIDAPARAGQADAQLIACWDFSVGIDTLVVTDRSPHRMHGLLHQLPCRGMTGVHWSGAVHDWRLAPREYGAIHFHSDDIYDCGWPATLVLDVPLDWCSGVHALRLRPAATHRPVDAPARHAETFITFFVTPAAGAHNLRTARPRAPLVLLAPSMTYMAYANSALRLHAVHFEVLTERLLMLTGDDVYLQEHPEIGQSTYDHHIDGSGRAYSSWLRPVLNMRPRATPGNLAIDTHFIDWLEEKGIDYELITDAELDRQGLGAIAGYRVLATLSHPEYYSQAMMNAIMAYQNGGGRHLALGANGFYWRCAWHPQAPAAVEVRRGISGTRTWESRPGEVHLAGTGEPGALWRHSGFAPQKLIGVGFAAMVYDHAGYYLLTPEAANPRVAFALQGIAQGERIGDYGVRAGGAVGIEIDRFDADLGSPPHAVILARSHGLGPGALPTPEEYRTTVHGLDAEQNALVRADMVFFETARGGAVFATGSIAYMLSLSHNGYDNDISRITANVLRRFLDPRPFEAPA
ncbi:N,N-dimethylformamidase [Verminephrobacter eiseniae]|uniref:N,N-dimethylformamidase beta subunit family domain-containing protein n=1 Tax=Verminephrobacter eiseniae TaxID=364317 RepID=UPI0022372352|nr:N,N-dimethylformamidase beta subunit family domain-containing protein [Verminephrobacter eiseniae]MCW5260200.1 N,N-dimethylformamidase [Verminephrobacter eiseniae]